MKYLLVLVVAAVAWSTESYMFNPEGDIYSSTYWNNWIMLYEDEIDYVESVVIFSADSAALAQAKVGMVSSNGDVPSPVPMPGFAVFDESLDCFSVEVTIQYSVSCVGYLYVEITGEDRIRATDAQWYRTRHGGVTPYDANVIFIGDGPGCPLNRTTWASIKSSF